MKPWQIGWFTVAVNLSDISAKGGKPLGLALSIGLPKNTSESFLKELMKGADACATQFGTSIVGGDTKETREIILSGTAFGTVKKDEFMGRKGAKPGDIVAVTGKLGKAAAGYYALKHNMRNKEILKGLLEPIPRIKEGIALAKTKIISSSMDISDGLSSSLYQLQELNNVGFEIDKEKIPLPTALLKFEGKKDINIYEYAMHFGGDYELLLTLPRDKFDKAQKSLVKTGTPLTVIGEVTKEKKINIIDGQTKKILQNKGYEHFRKHTFC
jgi:thiamine-monophosphate kinase